MVFADYDKITNFMKICDKTDDENVVVEIGRLKREAGNWEMEPGNWKMEPGTEQIFPEAGKWRPNAEKWCPNDEDRVIEEG